MLDVRRLRILQHLATYRTVAATAEALHLTAPAISQQLAVLEREAGVPVLEKQGRTLRLTAAGELLVAHAEVVLGDLAAAESELAALRGGDHGTVRVAAFASAARVLMPAVWRSIAEPDDDGAKTHDNAEGPTGRAARALTLQLVVQEPEDALEALRRRECDLAVVHGYTVLPRSFPTGCEQAALCDDPVLLGLHPDHAARLGLGEGEPVDLARFAESHWLVPGQETSCHEMIQRACGSAGFVPVVRARSNDFSVLTALVAAGAGVALVPRLARPEAMAPVSLHPLTAPVTRTVFTVSRAGTARRPDIKRLVELLRHAADEHGTAADR